MASFIKKALSIIVPFFVIGLATSMSFMEIGSVLIIAFWILALAQKVIPVPHLSKIPAAKPILIFVAIAVLGILMSDTTTKDKLYDLGRMRFFLLYFALFALLSWEGIAEKWLKPLFWTAVVISLYGFVQHFVAIDLIRPEGKKVLLYALQDEKIGPVVVGTFNHHLTFSNIYFFFASLFTSIGLCRGKAARKELVLGLFLFLLVAWTHSRMAWIALPFAALSLGFLIGRIKMALSVLGTTIVLMLVVFVSSQSLQDRFHRTFATNEEVSYAPRFRLWKANWQMFVEHPLIGTGWNTNERQCKSYMEKLYPDKRDVFCGHAHSTPLQVLVTTGILGFLAFLWIWFDLMKAAVLSLKDLDPNNRAIQIGLITAFTGFWVQGVTQWNFGDAEVAYNAIFFMSLSAALSDKKSELRII